MRNYQTLHLKTQIELKEQLVVRKVMDVSNLRSTALEVSTLIVAVFLKIKTSLKCVELLRKYSTFII
jgi:hypothetical protein